MFAIIALSRLLSYEKVGDSVEKVVEKLMGVLLHVVVKDFILFSKSGDELFRRYSSCLLLLSSNTVKEIGQTGEQGFLVATARRPTRTRSTRTAIASFVFGLVVEDLLAEGSAEVEGLEDGVAVAGIAKVDQAKVVLVRGKLVVADFLLQLRGIVPHSLVR